MAAWYLEERKIGDLLSHAAGAFVPPDRPSIVPHRAPGR
jgi:hypothetical protein